MRRVAICWRACWASSLRPPAASTVRGGHASTPACQPAGRQDGLQALPQAGLPHVGGSGAAPAVAVMVGEGQGNDGASGLDGRLQQGAVEVQQAAAVGGGAFREEGHHVAPAQDGADFLVDDPGMAAAAAAQENGVGARREPADDGPLPHFGLGDEGGRLGGVDQIDVQPGDMIGHQQAARGQTLQLGLQVHAEDVEQLLRPGLLQAQAPFRADQGIPQGHHQDAVHQVQHQAGQAEPADGAGQEMGFSPAAGWRCIQFQRPRKCLA